MEEARSTGSKPLFRSRPGGASGKFGNAAHDFLEMRGRLSRVAAWLRQNSGMSTRPSAAESALFPEGEPYGDGWLEVGEGHRVYFEQCGDPGGLPLLFLHGGPGSGCTPRQRRLFDPALFRVVLFDQRGCGRSTPRGGLRHNTTEHLIADIERLRDHLGVERWLVAGGSWGAALAIAYAAQHRDACLGLLLRGIFLTGRGDLDWFFQGAGQLVPQAWEAFAGFAPKRRRRELLHYYARVLERGEPARAEAAVIAWARYEEALTTPGAAPAAAAPPDAAERARLLDKYRVQAHYLTRRCFLGEKRLLADVARLHGLPTAILHGRLDLVCRPGNAWRVHRTLHGSRLWLVDGAGHSPFDAPMARALAGAAAHFALRRGFVSWGADR